MEKGLLNLEVEKVKSTKIDGAFSELASLFHGITGQESEPEVIVVEPIWRICTTTNYTVYRSESYPTSNE